MDVVNFNRASRHLFHKLKLLKLFCDIILRFFRKLKYEETVANIWPNFGTNRKELIKVQELPCVCYLIRHGISWLIDYLICYFLIQVHHLLNHTSGLHNALGDVVKNDPLLVCDWEETLNQIAKCTPETEPGSAQIYHYLSFGWLCGGVIEVYFFLI